LAQIFPEWTNKLPLILLVSAVFLGICAVGFFWYYGSPLYTDVGYRPDQPIDYSHKLHAGDLDIDCRYCHYSVEISPVANIPPTKLCMNCHTLVKPDSDKLQILQQSWKSGTPIKWIRVHKIGEYAYFNHSIHIDRGVSCVSCHGNVAEMEKVEQKEPLSMGWCLDCHRNPAPNLRPVSEVTNMKWVRSPEDLKNAIETINTRNIEPPTDCSGCHR
jgi:hypothetical protein